ncbi:MAG: cell wall metabolism sensor histidine kinase WalK [Acidaminococcaceae bacterium]|nr:cell wall metabolism sensor histidine kinase WalK [Acidaminococcaceae bacterium]
MKRSLSTRLMYSYMGLIAVIIVGVSVGLSYLITDYFFKDKERELNTKGAEVAIIANYFLTMDANSTSLERYLSSVDQLIGARIWLFDTKYELLATSEKPEDVFKMEPEGKANAGEENTKNPGKSGQARRDNAQKAVASIGEQIKASGTMHNQVEKILSDVYAGNRVNSRIFHPYYKEQVLLVGLPIKSETGKKTTGAILLAAPISGLNKVLDDIYLYTIVVGLIALCISMVIVNRLTRHMIRPLVLMKDSASAIAAGDYTLKVDVEGDDEISDLGRSLNSLGRDLDEFVKKTNKMEKLRRDFVANVSHELRTPITIIRGYNEAITDGTISDPEDIKKYRNLINGETIRLERLIKELLDISRLQRSDQEALADVPLGTIGNNVVDMLEVRAKKRDIRLERYIDDSLLVKGNGDRLFQLIMILGDNAMKYSPDSSEITFIVAEDKDHRTVLSVSDHGCGIPKEDIPYIWERFYKVDKSHSRNVPGTGLGLAIGKEIIRLHKATVKVESEIGKGTTFIVSFPSSEEKVSE